MASYEDKGIVDRIIDRQTYMEHIRQPWENDCDNIVGMFRPDMLKFEKKDGETAQRILDAKIYEGTGPWAMGLMSDGIQGHLVSRSNEWFRHGMDQIEFKGVDEVNAWLQRFDEHMYSVYRKSNFYDALSPFCRTGVSVGSPVILPEQDKYENKINCIVPHPVERYYMQNALGETNVLHLKSEWTIRNAVQEFGLKNFSQSVQDNYKSGDDGRKVTIVRTIYFYMDRIFDKLPKLEPGWDMEDVIEEGTEGTQGKPVKSFGKPNKPWMSIYIERNAEGDTNKGMKKPLRIEGYWSKPDIEWHYEKDMAEVYARTPSWYAYWDVKSMSANRKSMLMSGQRQVEPAWWVPSWLRGEFKSMPKGVNWYDPANKADKPEPLIEKSNYAPSADLEDRMAKAVERWFHVPMWHLLSKWTEQQKAPPTATQVIEMAGEKAVLLGVRMGRFFTALEQIDDRFIDLEQRAGRLPEPPDIILELSNGKISPEFIGPLAQIQKQYHSLRRTQTVLAAAEPLFALDPMVRHKIKAEVLMEHMLEENKFYQDAIRSDDEYRELLAAIAQKEAMAQAVQMGTEVAKSIPSVSKDVEPNSPLALLTGSAA